MSEHDRFLLRRVAARLLRGRLDFESDYNDLPRAFGFLERPARRWICYQFGHAFYPAGPSGSWKAGMCHRCRAWIGWGAVIVSAPEA